MPSVLIIVQNLPVPYDRRVWLEALTLREAGYYVSVISPTGQHDDYQKRYELIDGIHIYRYPAPPDLTSTLGYIFEFGYCWLMTALLSLWVWRKHGLDVVQACNPPETYFILGWFYQRFGKRFIFDHHDLSPEMYVAKGGTEGGLIYRALCWMETRTYHTADLVMCTNRFQREVAASRAGIVSDTVHIVSTGPDFDRLQPTDPDPSLKNGREYLVCYLGEMGNQDGVDHLLHIIDTYVHRYQQTHTQFMLIGGGPEWCNLRRMVDELGLSDYVTMTGRVRDAATLSRYLSSADVCVDAALISGYTDNAAMNKVGEYMAFGKPMVLTDLRANRELASDSAVFVAEDVVSFVEALVGLLADESRRKQMGRYAIDRAHHVLAWQHSKPALLAAYEQVLSRGKVDAVLQDTSASEVGR
jgi:glycosyltransferase involved in cell wall biosynthesis